MYKNYVLDVFDVVSLMFVDCVVVFHRILLSLRLGAPHVPHSVPPKLPPSRHRSRPPSRFAEPIHESETSSSSLCFGRESGRRLLKAGEKRWQTWWFWWG